MLTIAEAASGQTVDLPVGQVIELRLQENPTTGFRWHFEKRGEPVCKLADDFLERPEGATVPGQGGTHVWRIEGVQPGTCDMALAYTRAWDPGSKPAATFSVRIRVTG
ncbi:protease inhibitor I42 family protein [Limobrevibacterium gyesilva]|uniref:Protease inhibitor I42 family protein n=1 Tax=Limobrevibacterium gyesilva TaxID=2991712 RepID=A0AA41YKP8_9PROT|nr:protease inhibitor I42 family protein [Limobrevibacterium gyesilva]MCW3474146.1 protease inhibitor I42 family protein [Limobrevibacterium gyesilva]